MTHSLLLTFVKLVDAIESGNATRAKRARAKMRKHGFVVVKIEAGCFQHFRTFGARLWAARQCAPCDFAKKIGLSVKQLQNLESNRKAPTLANVRSICQVTGCSSDWLLFGRITNGKDIRVCQRDEDEELLRTKISERKAIPAQRSVGG